MKNKLTFNRLSYIMVGLLLCCILSSCGITHIEFTIQWSEVWKTIGLIALGAAVVVVIVIWMIKDFRLF